VSTTPSHQGGKGRLAQVIATRGGAAPPEAPFVIEHREALIYMLCEAAELEHGIMCQYLFAAFSLKQSTDEGLSDGELAAVTRWRKLVSHVATEEMLHLALVHNLLSAIGAAPHFARPNLPAPAHHYPAGVHLALVPFGEPALRHFMFLERPEGMALKDAEEFEAALEQATPLMAEGEIIPRLQDFATVGHLYRSIEQGIAHLAEKFGERWLFVGPPRAQATAKDFGWPELVAVTDLDSAQKAIDTILEQGEGARGHWEQAHFGQFVRILEEYRQMKEDNPGFEPVRPVMHAKVRPGERDEGFPLISDPITSRCTDLFNVGYEVLLQMFERYFAHTEESDAQLGTLADATIALMLRVLKPLGELITTLPVGPEHPGHTAGPSFELFYETDYLMPHREAAWMLLEERLREACVFCGSFQGDLEPGLSERLVPVAEALEEIADSLAAHFADWGAVSRYAAAQPSSAAPPVDVEALLERASELAATVGGALDQDASGQRELFDGAHALVEGLARQGGGADRIADSLVNSVLRPLATALTDRDASSEPTPAAVSTRIDPAQPVEASIWTLAQAATELRVGSPSGSPLMAALAEAAACLQRLALELSPAGGPDGLEARAARLRELQNGLAEEIRVSDDGPYLVTNAQRVRNWLGETILVPPQAALCRCGGSKSKPFCDGTHAQIGFSGEKDPNRVPDRRDTYVGQQVTILDNRGICQHSGFCTDRIATAFRSNQKPFVAPSGGRMDELVRAVRACPSGALGYAIDGVEAREDVDHHGTREAAIEVTKDGPYRITGAIPLIGARGDDVARNAGSSFEHYALCRCGHSQNKPFCSGMHWYIDFRDPVADPDREPTLFEWAGGLPALTRMTRLFYEKLVPDDPLLATLFANMPPDQAERAAKCLGEVFGGPASYSEEFGGYLRMLSEDVGEEFTEEARGRWVDLMLQAAQEARLPADPEFRSAFASYLEWDSRHALETSQAGAQPSAQMPMPRWGWGAAGPPDRRPPGIAQETGEEGAPPMLPAADEPVSFDAHIKPLFRERDRRSMTFAFDLWSYDDVSNNAEAILDRLRAGTMPCDGAWRQEQVEIFERWTTSGKQA
jgi:CDGSH-type Zn-finger protein/truncated hemoglobin YjbI